MLNVQSTCQIWRLNLTIFTVIGFHSFHVTSELPACGQENTLHSCLPLEFILELTIFHSISFNISALTLSDLGSKMLDSCCSVGCSNRRGDKPGCFQLIVDVFWVNFSQSARRLQMPARQRPMKARSAMHLRSATADSRPPGARAGASGAAALSVTGSVCSGASISAFVFPALRRRPAGLSRRVRL